MRFRPRPRYFIVAAFTLTAAITCLSIANWRPLVTNSLFRRVEDLVSTSIAAALVPVTPCDLAPPPPRRERRPATVVALEPRALIQIWQAGGTLPAKAFVVLANTPAEYQWYPLPRQLWLMEASTEAAVALGVDAVVDASAADGLRSTTAGRETARRLREAGILRTVVFDGGHHLPGLALEPDLAILPVLRLRGTAYACHIHLRDAVPLPALARYAAAMGLRTRFFTVPRLFTMAKTKNAMAALLVKALAERGGKAASGLTYCDGFGRLGVEGWRKLPVRLNALDLLRMRMQYAFRRLTGM